MRLRLGRYQTMREVAVGGMATVYLGRALGEGGFARLVAIKLLHRQFADQAEFEAMFLDEAKLAAKIRHPNVVPTLDVQKSSEGLFIVMEYVEGPTLASVHKELRASGQRIPLGIVMRIVEDMLAGLEAAHRLKGPGGVDLQIVHRDVSPQNVLIGGDGITRITDFGVARAAVRTTTTEQGQIKGKLGYMPPEQLAGDAVDSRADVYAAGVVLWEALTGRRAFSATNTGVLVARVLAGIETAPGEIDPKLPVAIDRACMHALAIDPADRPQTAADFARELADAARSAGIAVAKTRQVSDYVQSLGAYRERVVPPEVLAELDQPDRDDQAARPTAPPTAAGSIRQDDLSGSTRSASGTRAAVALSSAPARPSRSRWGLGVAIAGCVAGLAVGGAIAGLMKGSSDPAASSGTAGAADGVSIAPAFAAPPPGSQEARGDSADVPAPASATAATTNSAAAGNEGGAAASTSPVPTVEPGPTAPGTAARPRPTSSASKTAGPPTALPSNPEDYNPSDL